jgi:hypothetical protein
VVKKNDEQHKSFSISFQITIAAMVLKSRAKAITKKSVVAKKDESSSQSESLMSQASAVEDSERISQGKKSKEQSGLEEPDMSPSPAIDHKKSSDRNAFSASDKDIIGEER